jgi:hypothetical protein
MKLQALGILGFWLIPSLTLGRVRGALDELKKEMSKAEIRAGQQLAKEWTASHRPK